MTIDRTVAKRTVAASRALSTWLHTLATRPSNAAVDHETGLQLLDRLDAATDTLARAVYTTSPATEK